MTKLYKGFDTRDLAESLFLINDKGCAPMLYMGNDESSIILCKLNEDLYSYEDISYFENCIKPILIAEW